MKNKLPYIAAYSYTLIIGFSFLFTKSALEDTSPLLLLAHRYIIAFVAYIIYLYISGSKLNLSIKNIWTLLPLSFFYPIGMFMLQAFGLLYISSSETGILFAITPIMTLILSVIFLKEKASIYQQMGIYGSVIGIAIVFIFQDKMVTGNMLGYGLIIASVVSSSIYIVYSKYLLRRYELKDIVFATLLFGSITFNFIFIIFSNHTGTVATYVAPLLNRTYILKILYLGIFSSFMSTFLSTYAISKLSVVTMSIFPNIATLISIFAGIFVLGESIHMNHIIGTLIIIGSVLIMNNTKFPRHMPQVFNRKAS